MNGSGPDRFLPRLFRVSAAAVVLFILWEGLPWLGGFLGTDSAPRVVVPRGDLAADEKSTIELFEKAKNSVVYISTQQRVLDPWTRNVFNVPRGTG